MARKDDERQIYNEEQGHSLLGTAVSIGAIIGAGAMGWRYRSQIGSGIRAATEFTGTIAMHGLNSIAKSSALKNTVQDISAFNKALNYAADSRGITSHIKKPGRFEDRFNQSLQYSLEAKARSARSQFGGEPLEALNRYQDMRNTMRATRKQVFESQRFDNIVDEVKQSMGEHADKGLLSMLATRDSNWFYNMTHGKVEAFTNTLLSPEGKKVFAHGISLDDTQRKKFEMDLFNTLSKFQDMKSVGTNVKEVNRVTKDINHKIRNGYITSHQQKDDFTSRVQAQAGWTRATIEDLVSHKNGNLLAAESDAIGIPLRSSGKIVKGRYGSKTSKLLNADPRYRDLVADPHLWINANGEFMDTRWMAKASVNFAESFRNSVQIPFLRFNPLDLMHFSTWEGMKNAPKNYFKKIGTIDPGLHGAVKELQHPLAHNQDAKVGVLGSGYINTADGNVYSLTTGDLVKQDVYQASGRFGMVPRAMAGMANLHTQDYGARKGVLGVLGKLFDVGKQETESIRSRMATTFTKFNDYEWGPNILNGMYEWQAQKFIGLPEEFRTGLSPESGYKLIYSQLESKTTSLSDDTVSYINRKVKSAYGDIGVDLAKLNTEDEIMSTLGVLRDAIMTPNSGVARLSNKVGDKVEGLDKLIVNMWDKYAMNPTQFMHNQRILPDHSPYLPEALSGLDISETQLVSKVDDVKRLIHMHASRQLEYSNAETVGSLVQQGIASGELTENALKEVRNIETLTTMRQWWDDIYKNPLEKERALDEFASEALHVANPLSSSIQGSMEDTNKWWSMGPGQEPPQYFGLVEHISMNKGKGYKWALQNYNNQKTAGASPSGAALDSILGVVSQPFAGRSNPGKVTTATLPFYYMSERLDNAVAQVGLGLSQKNRGSMQSILANQFGRRVVLPYAAYQQAMWLDGTFGDVFSDKAADTYANMHEDVSWIKEFTGLNDIGRQWSRVFSGGDQIAESPLVRGLNFLTLGIFGDSRSGQEVHDFYESGEVAIRKGRYWGVGSNTPFTGGKIDRYEPNWYRKLKSDYKFTDTMYGSESEYWANNWMPTLTHPLAPLKHFLTDPYHWEEKHKEDRPYAVTGGFSELQQIPLVGRAIDNTLGRILKPRHLHPDLEKAHRAYIEEINANITAQYQQAGEGGLLQGMPAGGINISQGALGVPQAAGGAGGTGGGAESTGGIVGVTPEQYAMMIGSGTGSGGASGTARGQIAAINSYYSEIGGPSLGATGKNVRSITALEDLRDPDVLADLNDIGTSFNLNSTLRDSFYSASEMGGIYGFLTKGMIGFKESGRGMTLDDSSRMTSYQRAWWDMELGGLGGQMSEIGRRYLPRDPNKNYWNPIKNKMPDWLPGTEYFVDFKHGDPYTKVAHGEMRLPGKAYEQLYKLHPDALGDYGTFDRFRILADVAPYSENYKFYRQMVSKMNQSGMLSDDLVKEYAEVRDQVSARKDKHRFYNRRFDHADVNYETVHITRMLDATTFLTSEHPNNPIRMSGVKVKSDDEESIKWLQQYVHEGAEVRIGVDADPLFRVRDDTYNTMHAVVYANKNDEAMPFYQSTKGQNVNFMLANRKTGGLMGLGGKYKASVHDDGTATATKALFSNDMVTVGKLWETITHDILPSVPIVGTITDKFLQVRSPLEMYKKNEVYGKAWRPWTDPIDGWIRPMVESVASHHPIIAAAQGAGIGWLFTKKGAAKFWGTRIGAVVGGGVATTRVFLEQGAKLKGNKDSETWLPERRRKEREINEYFDKIKYVKYKGLYERARIEALDKEGVDIEALLAEQEERGSKNKSKRNVLKSTKKWLSMNKKLGYGDKEATEGQLDKVRDDLKEIDADRPTQSLGKYSMLALRYKTEYESTLYGADENGDMTKIFRALPNKDREFFTEFMKAAPDEREEILRLVPKDQRKFYQAKWGMEVDKKESLQSYFSSHYLPSEDWKGWKPDTSIENYKLKVVKNESLELTEFGYWGDDEKRAEQSQATVLPIQNISSLLDVGRLEKALRGAGLTDVSVSMDTGVKKGENKIDLAMDIMKDRSRDIITEINNNLGGLFN